MAAVDVVRRLSSFVRAVKQAAIFGVSEKELSQAATSTPNCNVEGSVSFLENTEEWGAVCGNRQVRLRQEWPEV